MTETETKPDKLLPLERNDKLKMYGMVALDQSVPEELVKDKIYLSTCLAYTDQDAVVALANEIRKLPAEPKRTFKIPWLMLSRPLDELIETPTPMELITPEVEVEKKKTDDDLVAYVRYVFESGSNGDRELAEGVIKQFYARKTETKN